MRHTPGPWRLHSDGLSVFGAGPNSQQVADLGVCSPNIKKREQLANARLIAAAPDLLDALKDALNYLESTLAPCEEGCDCILHLIESAIANAEGRAEQAVDGLEPLTADEKNGAAVKPKAVRP